MSESQESEVNQEQVNTESTETQRVELTSEQRIEVLQEISILQQLIATPLYFPKMGMRTDPNTKQVTSVPTESVKLHYFGQKQLQEWGNRIIQLTNLL